jgi:hypothetical protein
VRYDHVLLSISFFARRDATIFQCRGAGNFACSRLSGGSRMRLCCYAGQDCILLAGFPTGLFAGGEEIKVM